MTFMSICRCAGSRGNCSAPPSPANAQPNTTAPSISGFGLTPSAANMWRSCVAARRRLPNSEYLSSPCKPSQTKGPSAIMTNWYTGKKSSPICTAPLSPGNRGANTSSGPNPHCIASCSASVKPKVATSWYNSGAPAILLNKKNSATAPARPAQAAPKKIAIK